MDRKPAGFHRWLSLVVLLLAAAIGAFLLFVPPAVGLADQGDFARVMHAVGLRYPASVLAAPKPYFCFANMSYRIAPLEVPSYPTSEFVFVSIARIARRLAGRATVFDMRLLGLVHLLALLVAVCLLLHCARNLHPMTQCAFAVLVLLAGCDIGYLAYFNSFYSEPATYLFGLMFVASVLLLVDHPSPSRVHLGSVFVTLVLFAGAKPQNLPVLLVVIPFLAFSLRRITPHAVGWKFTWALGALLICAGIAGAGVLVTLNYGVRMTNLYNSIFLQVLPYSPSPASDLAALGLDPKMGSFSGQSAFAAQAVMDDPSSFPQQASYLRLLRFYLSRPSRLYELTSRGVGAALSNRVSMLGNYERSVGRPCAALSPAFGVWDEARKLLRSLWLVAAFMLVNMAAPFWFSLRVSNPRISVLLQFQAAMALAAVLVFYTAILGDGNEFQKHLFVFNFLFDGCLVADLLWLIERAGYLV